MKPMYVAGLLLCASTLSAQFPRSTSTQTATVQLQVAVPTLVALPPLPPCNVICGTQVRFLPPPSSVPGTIRWYRNGVPFADSDVLQFASASWVDTGSYHAVSNVGGFFLASENVTLAVQSGERLVNVSTRVRLGGAQSFVLCGFVVTPGASHLLVLVRAVGPSLTRFGVTDPLANPALKLTNVDGLELPPVATPDGGVPSVAEAANRVGAFPLGSGSADIARLYRLPPGNYTVHLSAADGGSGTALCEVYHVPVD
ncbi:MAG TPA: hypothetical protein VHE61_08085 [Opitutaceae bacterium]|nr:hypothetical protein [Opitutaceae bacterium]